MRLHVDCIPCYFRQALQASRFSTDDEDLHWKTVRAVAKYLSGISPGQNSILVSERVHEIIKESLGDPDPYLSVKEEFTAAAEGMEPQIEKIAAEGGDPLLSAVKLAIAGNIIDFGAGGTFDVETAIRGAMHFSPAIDHFNEFRSTLDSSRTVLYIGDNTGELYFDKPLLRLLGDRDVTFVVRGGPSLNDATIDYARRAGIDKIVRVEDTGLASMGFPLDRIRPEVHELFQSADMVIAKGQANFESLHDTEKPGLFFLMKVKCELVAGILGANFGDIVVIESGRVPMND